MKHKILIASFISIELFAPPEAEQTGREIDTEEIKLNQQERISQDKASVAQWHEYLQARTDQTRTSQTSDPAQELRDKLGVNSDATNRDLTKAYKKIALENHPDKNNDKTQDEINARSEKFKSAKDAYDILTDPEELSKYRAKIRSNETNDPEKQKALSALTKATEIVSTIDRYLTKLEIGQPVDITTLNEALKAQYKVLKSLSSDNELTLSIHDWAKSMITEISKIKEEITSQSSPTVSPQSNLKQSSSQKTKKTTPLSKNNSRAHSSKKNQSSTRNSDTNTSSIEKAIDSGDTRKITELYHNAQLEGAGHLSGTTGAINDLIQPIVTKYMDLYRSGDLKKIDQATKYAKDLESKLKEKNVKLWNDIHVKIEREIKSYNLKIKKAHKLAKDLKKSNLSGAEKVAKAERTNGETEEQIKKEAERYRSTETAEQQKKSRGVWQQFMDWLKKLFHTNKPAINQNRYL